MIARKQGVTRSVYLVGHWAIKVPRLCGQDRLLWRVSRAILANLSEAEWSDSPDVAPVRHLWLGGLIAIYPRCEPWPDGPEPDYDTIGAAWMPRDRKPQNVGLLNGQAVWVDYDGSWNGCPHSTNVGAWS